MYSYEKFYLYGVSNDVGYGYESGNGKWQGTVYYIQRP